MSVDELVLSTKIALDETDMGACPRSDGDGQTSINELIGAVAGAMNGFPRRDADESLLYTNVLYDDPIVLRYDPAMALSTSSTSSVFPDERTLIYCALYDNGFTDPEAVKRRSTSPVPPIPLGGPCNTPTGCVSGRLGEACRGSTQSARDASCDSTPNAADGSCDACPLRGGVTTEDEMFLILGAYYLP